MGMPMAIGDVEGDGDGDGETDWQRTAPSLRTVPKSTWSFTSISSFEPSTCNQKQRLRQAK